MDDESGEPKEKGPDLRHLQKQTRLILDQDVEARVRYAQEDHWIGYGAARHALDAMKDLVSLPHTTTSPSLLLLGRAGNGKTTILNKLCSSYPPTTRTTDDLECKVISMSFPPGGLETEFWSEILHACGIGHRVTDPFLLKKEQAYSVLRRMRPSLLIGDELNNLLLGSGAAQRMIMARIRELTNKLSIHLVLAGTEEAASAASSDPQLHRRLPPYELPRWGGNETECLRLFRSFESLIPLRAPSNLVNDDMATRILARCDGSIASIATTIKDAGVLAIRAGTDRILPEHIDALRLDTPEERARRASRL